MLTTRPKVIQGLHNEAMELRAWADHHLPETARYELYTAAARLEKLAAELAAETVWQRVGGEVQASTRAILGQAQRSLRRRAG